MAEDQTVESAGRKRLPRIGTPERVAVENRRACTAFWGPNGSCGGHPSDFDEPGDLVETGSAMTRAEWLESQMGQFVDGVTLPEEGEEGAPDYRYPALWYGYVATDLGPEYVMQD